MTTASEFEHKIAGILVRQLRLREDATLSREDALEDIGLDSLGMLGFVASLERDFGIGVSDSDYDSLRTFGDAVDLVRRLAA